DPHQTDPHLVLRLSSVAAVLEKSGRTGPRVAAVAAVAAVAEVSASPVQANGFLNRLRRPRRNIWDRSRPDVQQWILQFMSMGYDEARLETDLSYWRDQWRSSDQGRQHHYDENAAVGPQDSASYRHGANVNYDYY
uniref:ECRG4 augurin precursor a n=1 Tax=Lates calcarifer TaxID=8187 RepID=A0A4W6G1Z8_LATCA